LTKSPARQEIGATDFGASELETISPWTLVRALALTGLAAALVALALGDPGSLSGGRTVAGLLMAGA
jgi:hypothetical protein